MPKNNTAYVAGFDLGKTGASEDDLVVYRDALLFRVGDYPEKNFSLSTAEAAAAVEQFGGPIPNEIQHINSQFGQPTILDGKLGEVLSVRLSEDGVEIRGEVAIPRWLDAIWQGKKQVSCVWDRATKTLAGLGLVVKGHLPDAALMAAFADADPGEEEKPSAARVTDLLAQTGMAHDLVESRRAAEAAAIPRSERIDSLLDKTDLGRAALERIAGRRGMTPEKKGPRGA